MFNGEGTVRRIVEHRQSRPVISGQGKRKKGRFVGLYGQRSRGKLSAPEFQGAGKGQQMLFRKNAVRRKNQTGKGRNFPGFKSFYALFGKDAGKGGIVSPKSQRDGFGGGKL